MRRDMEREDLSWLDAPPEQEQPLRIADIVGPRVHEPRRSAVEEVARPTHYVHRGTTYKNLTPQESRVVLMRCAGATEAAIAVQIESDSLHVQRILARPHVAKEITKLSAQFATDAAPVIRNINAEIEAVAADAFDRLRRNMEIFDEVGDSRLAEGDYKNGLRAKLGCVATTQDILDRAGKRAPTKTLGAVMHVVAPEQLEKLERIIGDATSGEGRYATITPGPAGEDAASITHGRRGEPTDPRTVSPIGPNDASISPRPAAEPSPRSPEAPTGRGGVGSGDSSDP